MNVEEAVLKELEQHAISVAVATLPRHQKYAIQQAYFGGQSAREIAHEVGVPVSTVKGRPRMGLERLARDVDLRIATGRADA